MTFGPPGGRTVFRIGDERLTLRRIRPADAVDVALRADWWALVPGLLTEQSFEAVVRALSDPEHPMDIGHVHDAAQRCAVPVYGVSWWSACTVLRACAGQWVSFEAWCVEQGYDPRSGPAARTVAAGWGWLRSTCADEKDMERMRAAVFDEPVRPGQVPPERGMDEAEVRAAQAVFGPM